ncbi:ArsR/SmtB family transcription factor [Anaeromicropila herbilytica]|nr:ArsR family transcriptional regulator [Anaeromicropila herbilytica]
MMQTIKMSLDDTKHLSLVSKALSAEIRIEILKLLCSADLNINEIAEKLKIPASSAASHIKVLEEASLIKTSLQPGVRGSMKLCKKQMDEIGISLTTHKDHYEEQEIISMPIGNYVDYKVEPTCGLVNEKGPIDEEDEPRCFYNPLRTTAKLLWFQKGYVEYRFPNNVLKQKKEKKLELSFEICSEDHEYNLDCPSDITVWINGIEAGTYTCPSDFGGRRGTLNPSWWPDKNTQYGELKTFLLTEEGTFINNMKVNDKSIMAYELSTNEYISIRIGIKEDSNNIGGINLFGDSFGDYPQDILLRFIF